jgi:hypothetical protein
LEEKMIKAFNRPLRLVAALALLLGVLFWSTNRTRALNPQPLPPHNFGILGIVSGQTARLHVVNTDSPCPAGQPCPSAQVELSFVSGDPDNPNVIGSVFNAQLAPGQSTHLDLNPDTVGIPPGPPNIGGRVEFRAVVKVSISPGPQQSPAPCAPPDPTVSTLEMIDNSTGKAALVLYPPGPCMVGCPNAGGNQ